MRRMPFWQILGASVLCLTAASPANARERHVWAASELEKMLIALVLEQPRHGSWRGVERSDVERRFGVHLSSLDVNSRTIQSRLLTREGWSAAIKVEYRREGRAVKFDALASRRFNDLERPCTFKADAMTSSMLAAGFHGGRNAAPLSPDTRTYSRGSVSVHITTFDAAINAAPPEQCVDTLTIAPPEHDNV